MIRDEVVVVEVLEQAGRQIVNHEADHGTLENLYGFAWVTLRNVAISWLRRGPHLLEMATLDSAASSAMLARLPAVEGSPEAIQEDLYLRQVLKQVSPRERNIAIWKRSGFSSRWIADQLAITVSCVDTTYSRLKEKLKKLLGPG